jgi:hypothetical protein
MSTIFSVFYFHDKEVLNAAAYEVVNVGSLKMREKDAITEEKLEEFFTERIKGKCLLMKVSDTEVSIVDEEIAILVKAKGRKMGISVEKKAKVTYPEKYIRNIKKIKESVS